MKIIVVFGFIIKKSLKNLLKQIGGLSKNKLTNFRHYYGITERSALGYHAMNINYFKATLLPSVNEKPDPNCFIEHITNNYFNKFSEIEKKKL